jgi:hypothetical protein
MPLAFESACNAPGRIEMEMTNQQRGQHAWVSFGLLGMLLAVVVACGDFTALPGEIVIVAGAQAQVAEALGLNSSKLNRFKPSAAIAKKISDKWLPRGSGNSAFHSDTGNVRDMGAPSESSDPSMTTLTDCPRETNTEQIPCDVLGASLDPMNTGASELAPECTCRAESWCEEDGEGVCICYTEVSDCD